MRDLNEIENLKERVVSGGSISRDEALEIADGPLEGLCRCANDIRRHFCGRRFDMCSIINGKSGRCSEDCRFCAQAGCYDTRIDEYPLLDRGRIAAEAERNRKCGAMRYSIVTSGRKLNDSEVDELCASVKKIKGIKVCVSAGLISEEQFRKLKEAGVSRIHNNLETGRTFFSSVCTTHSYDEKIAAVKAAKRAGLEVCSGGIIGLGETMEDRVEMACTLRDLDIRSVPVNILDPVAGTPLESQEPLSYSEIRRTIAVFRFMLPEAFIRLAGGRELLPDMGRACLISGANAAITGDMLTKKGISTDEDREMISELGYEFQQ